MKILVVALLIASMRGLIPRQAAPEFSAKTVFPDKSVKTVSLSDYRDKYVVLLFYPFDFTYVCPTELLSFSDNAEQFTAINAEVLAVSVDSQFSHIAWMNQPRNQGGINLIRIPLVSDLTKEISRNYGVLVEDRNDDLFGASLRGLFIIDGKGIIRSMTINDAPVGRSVDEAIRTIKALQHADQHGVVCPANWKPGSKTIVPDQDKKIEFFSGL